jgi:hypothetical protein
MAFPGTYNFSYYRGDTLEFQIYPKTPSGSPFPLSGYDVEFNIASQRGAASEDQINAFSAISPDGSFIACAIVPRDGQLLEAGRPYVYDIEISKLDDTNYPKVYTILTGDITVVEQVTLPAPITVSRPNPPTNLEIEESPPGTVNVSWTAPTEGDAPTGYKIYGKSLPLVSNYTEIVTVTETEYSSSDVFGFPFQSGATYDIKVVSVNAAGESLTGVEGSVTIA